MSDKVTVNNSTTQCLEYSSRPRGGVGRDPVINVKSNSEMVFSNFGVPGYQDG